MAEVARVLKPDGAILHEWGNGAPDEERVAIRERARQLFEDAGVRDPFHPGVRSESEVETVFRDAGFDCTGTLVEPGGAIPTLAEFLRRIVDGDCSCTWEVPSEIQSRCLPELERWAATQFNLSQPRVIPRDIRWTIYRRRG